MSKVMKTTSLSALLERISGEYLAKRTIFEIPEGTWLDVFAQETESTSLMVMATNVSIPLGPAAGPHTQIAPNLVAAYLAGSRVFELKTVQENDHLDIEKPCIDALDEGHNVEWSTELTLEQARMEYLNAWIALNLLARMWSHKPNEFIFNMSVGYTLDGIKSEKMDAFIEGMRRPEVTHYWEAALEELNQSIESELFVRAFGQGGLERAREIAEHMPVRPVHSVTLSTMHGCPPDEIERIGRYFIEEKGFDTYIKLNPTLLGYDATRNILDRLGWSDIQLRRQSFDHDLQFDTAVEIIHRLSDAAGARGRRFGIKLSNTLANANDASRLPGEERYMSGRALFPLTITLAARLARALPEFPQRFSYCGGVSAWNAPDLIKAGLGPLTIATDILKPGGYQRISHMVKEVLSALQCAPEKPDLEALNSLSTSVFDVPFYYKNWKEGDASIPGLLPVFNCFAAPCVEACPVHQKVPAYIAATGKGDVDRGLSIILSDNPLPTITGVLCDHVCQEHCSRVDYEGAVRIRDMKLATVRGAQNASCEREPENRLMPEIAWQQTAIGKTAIIGAGPSGLSCAWYLAQHGQKAVIFETDVHAGGVPANTIPSFRISRQDIASDIERLEKCGVEFRFNSAMQTPEQLKNEGFDAIVLAHGAHTARNLSLTGSGVKMTDALEFLGLCMKGQISSYRGVRDALVVGGGNTACDAVRMATRIPGIASVYWSYRRTMHEMPADREEFENAIAEVHALDARKHERSRQALLELTLPEALEPGKVRLRRMKLGEKDASGRRSPIPTEYTFSLPCDLIITAVGEQPNAELFKRFGIVLGQEVLPTVDPVSMESEVPGIFVCGDARRGPSSIIAAEADGRSAAFAILRKHGMNIALDDYEPSSVSPPLRVSRGKIIAASHIQDPDFAQREAERCLACDTACLRCVEVCPNRANMVIDTARAFDQPAQILHIDRLCNECGNCAFFCPWNGEPFSGKPTLFDTQQEFDASKNPGFVFIGNRNRPMLRIRTSISGDVVELPFMAWNGSVSLPEQRDMIAFARTIWANHRYLVEVNE